MKMFVDTKKLATRIREDSEVMRSILAYPMPSSMAMLLFGKRIVDHILGIPPSKQLNSALSNDFIEALSFKDQYIKSSLPNVSVAVSGHSILMTDAIDITRSLTYDDTISDIGMMLEYYKRGFPITPETLRQLSEMANTNFAFLNPNLFGEVSSVLAAAYKAGLLPFLEGHKSQLIFEHASPKEMFRPFNFGYDLSSFPNAAIIVCD